MNTVPWSPGSPSSQGCLFCGYTPHGGTAVGGETRVGTREEWLPLPTVLLRVRSQHKREGWLSREATAPCSGPSLPTGENQSPRRAATYPGPSAHSSWVWQSTGKLTTCHWTREADRAKHTGFRVSSATLGKLPDPASLWSSQFKGQASTFQRLLLMRTI